MSTSTMVHTELVGDDVIAPSLQVHRSRTDIPKTAVSTTQVHELNSDASQPPPYSAAVANGPASQETEWEDVQPTDTNSPNLEISESRLLDIAASFFPAVPPDAELPVLSKPVLIPRVNPGAQIPFARAWAPELANHSIVLEDFITFIDNLNILIAPHAIIRSFEIAGAIVGVVPYDIAEAVGGAVEGLAILAHILLSYRNMKLFMSKINENYFHPRKLHLKVINTKRMMKMLDLDKKDPLVAPLSAETLDLSVQDRCLKHLEEKVCELKFDDIPPPSKQTTALAKIAAWQTKQKINKAEKQAKRSRKRAWKKHEAGKPFKQGKGEKLRIKQLDWLMIQNYHQWEERKAEKQAKKEERRQTSRWPTWS